MHGTEHSMWLLSLIGSCGAAITSEQFCASQPELRMRIPKLENDEENDLCKSLSIHKQGTPK